MIKSIFFSFLFFPLLASLPHAVVRQEMGRKRIATCFSVCSFLAR